MYRNALLLAIIFGHSLVFAQEKHNQIVTMTIEENVQKEGQELTKDKSIKPKLTFGAVLSLTGKTKDVASNTKNGYDLAVTKINERGGVRVGDVFYELDINYADDASDNKVVGRAFESLVKQNVNYILGPYGSGLTALVAPLAEKYKIPFMSQGSVKELFTPNWKYIFGPGSSGDEYLKPAVNMLGELAIARGRKPQDLKVMVISRDDPGSVDIKAGVLDTIKEWGMQLVGDVVVSQNNGDVTKAIEKAGTLLPDLLVATVQAEGAKNFVQVLADKKIDFPMVAMTHCDTAKIHELKEKADYILCSSQWDAFLDYGDRYFGSTVEYTTDYYLRYSLIPPYQTAQASSSVILLADAIERAQSLDREKVRETLVNTDLKTVYGNINFGTKKNQGKPIILHQLMQGEYKIVYPQKTAWARTVYPMPSWEERIAE